MNIPEYNRNSVLLTLTRSWNKYHSSEIFYANEILMTTQFFPRFKDSNQFYFISDHISVRCAQLYVESRYEQGYWRAHCCCSYIFIKFFGCSSTHIQHLCNFIAYSPGTHSTSEFLNSFKSRTTHQFSSQYM